MIEEYAKDILSAICELVFSINDLKQIEEKFIEICSPWIKEIIDSAEETKNLRDYNKNNINSIEVSANFNKNLSEIIYIFKRIILSSYESINYSLNEIKSQGFHNDAEHNDNAPRKDSEYIKQQIQINSEKKKILSNTFKEIWEPIKILIQSPNSTIVENTIQLLKHFMRGMRVDFNIYMQEYLGLICKAYSLQPFPSYLYAFEVSLSIIPSGCDQPEFIVLKSILDELSKITFELYLKTSFNYQNNTQLTEDIFGLYLRCIKLNPLVILDSSYFENILIISINCIDLKHPTSSLNVIYFLEKVITFENNKHIRNLGKDVHSFYYKKISDIILKHGETLILKIFTYLQSVPLEMILEHLINLSLVVIFEFENNCYDWHINCLKSLPDNCLTNTEKDKFAQSIEAIVKLQKSNKDTEIYAAKLVNYYRTIYNRCLALNYKENN